MCGRELKLSWPLDEAMTGTELQRLMFSKENKVSPNKRMPDYAYIHKDLLRNGVSKKLLWTEYMEDCRANGEEPLMYSQFCYHFQQYSQLRTYSGTVITDGYQVYHKFGRECEDLTIGGCWIHARRPFAEFIKSIRDSADGTIAQKAYTMITEMLHIDNEFNDLPSGDRLKQRQLVLSEKVDAYFAWVKRKFDQVTHNSTIGKALAYSIHQEPYLRTFLT